jgi:NAD(P)-dependent dehydrogenase (short-subunit alcohol dehydrogenase family)
MSLRFQRAIIVGGSSGMGAEMARQLSAEGVAVAIVGHRADEVAQVAERLNAAGKGRVIAATHDVRDYDDAPPLFEQLVAELGGLDLLIYAAGIMYVPEEGVYDFGQDRAQMEINVVGAMAWTNIAAARFEAQRGGTIVGLSSIAGERGRRTMPGYTTSKAALTAWFEALRNRVARYGVNVVTVKPGVVDTPMTRDLVRKPPMMISAERAASLILATARRGGSPSAFIPARWGLVALVLHHLPSSIFRRLNL